MDFTDIEDRIKDRIRTSMPYVKVVETYAGQLGEDLERLPVPFPAVFVAYGGSAYEWVDGRSFNDAPTFSIIVAARDVRGSKELRQGEYGCYRMIKDVLSAAANQTLGLDMWPLKPLRTSLLFLSKTMAAYGIDFRTSFDKAVNSQEAQ
jgi:phage gp37-like protein